MLGRGHNGIKVIDFEWLGFGLPHMDLATALKGSPAVRDQCIEIFSERLGLRSYEDDRRLFLFCAWQRALLDTAFRAKQSRKTESSRVGYSSDRVISRSARNAFAAYKLFTLKD
jgi:thiamine kinase-like enzyme